jgi:cytochrome P450
LPDEDSRFREWAKEYGSVYSVKFGPTNIIVLCDRKAIHALLDKKGAIYSDRPQNYVGRLLTQGDHIALEQMDPVWREKRKVISHNFSPKNLDEKHFLVQEAEYGCPQPTAQNRCV